jgi:hypothetical protein
MARNRKPFRPSPKKFEVGYGRPPASSRWGPGRSGNPSGKRKGTKSRDTIVNEIMNEKISISENGKQRKITAFEGILRVVRNSGLKGSLRAAAFLIKEHAAAQAADATRQANIVRTITSDMTLEEAAKIYAQTVRRPLSSGSAC